MYPFLLLYSFLCFFLAPSLLFCLIQICFCFILFSYYSVDSCLFCKGRQEGCDCTWGSGQENLRGSWEEEMSPEYIVYTNIYSQYVKNKSSKEKRKEKDILLIVVASGTMVFNKGGFIGFGISDCHILPTHTKPVDASGCHCALP